MVNLEFEHDIPANVQEEKQGKVEEIVNKANALIDKYQDKVSGMAKLVLSFGIIKGLGVEANEVDILSNKFDQFQEIVEEKIAEGIDNIADLAKSLKDIV